MKSFLIAIAVAAGLFLSAETANAQLFGGGRMGGGYNSYLGSGYSYPGSGYSNPGWGNSYYGRPSGYSNYGYSNYGSSYYSPSYSNYGSSYSNLNYGAPYYSPSYSTSAYGYSNPSYSNATNAYAGYSASVDPCCCTAGTNYYGNGGASGYPPTATGTSGYPPTNGTIVPSGYTPVDTTGSNSSYSPTMGDVNSTYPAVYSDNYSYPITSTGRSSRGLLGWRR